MAFKMKIYMILNLPMIIKKKTTKPTVFDSGSAFVSNPKFSFSQSAKKSDCFSFSS